MAIIVREELDGDEFQESLFNSVSEIWWEKPEKKIWSAGETSALPWGYV